MNLPISELDARTRTRTRAVDTDTRPGETPVPSTPSPQAGTTTQGAVGYVHTHRTAYGNEAEDLEEVRVPIFNTEVARVRISGSVTQNLGDFNSARVEVTVEMPCLPVQSEIDRVYLDLSQRVDLLCRRELAVATGQPIPQE